MRLRAHHPHESRDRGPNGASRQGDLGEAHGGLRLVELEGRLLHLLRAHVPLRAETTHPLDLGPGPRPLGLVPLEREPLVAVVDDEEGVPRTDALPLANTDLEDLAVRLGG